MNAMCRPSLCVLLVIACCSFAAGAGKPSPKQSEYEQFIQPFREKGLPGLFRGPKVPLQLIVTAFTDDDSQKHAKDPFSLPTRYGCEVAADGQVSHFHSGPFGAQGGG